MNQQSYVGPSNLSRRLGQFKYNWGKGVMRTSPVRLFAFCVLFALASSIVQAAQATQKSQRHSNIINLLCNVMLTVPLVNQDPAQSRKEMTPTLPSTGGGPSFQRYYVNMDITNNKAAIYLSKPDEPGSKPWIQFSNKMIPLGDQKDRAEYYLLENGKFVSSEVAVSNSILLWVDRNTGWFELVTTYPAMPYPSKSWEVGICSDQKYKF